MTNLRNQRSGFTLIEILVTTAILILMATVAIPATRTTERKVKLRQSAATIGSYIGEARTLALAPQAGPVSVVGYGTVVSQASEALSLVEFRSSGPARTIRSETLPPEVSLDSIVIAGSPAEIVTIRFNIGERAEITPNQPVSIRLSSGAATREVTFSPHTGFAEIR